MSATKRPISDLSTQVEPPRKKSKTSPEEMNPSFFVNPKRIKELNEVALRTGNVVYWMSRDQRTEDNWALLYAIQMAHKNNTQVHVLFNVVTEFLGAPLRTFKFMFDGLKTVREKLHSLNIPFHLYQGQPDENIGKFVRENEIKLVVCDFSPLKLPRKWVNDVNQVLSASNCSFHQVDAHNIVPVWITSQKQEYAARTIRSKIHKQTPEFLVNFPLLDKKLIPQSNTSITLPDEPNWQEICENLKCNNEVQPVDLPSGEKAAHKCLETFCTTILPQYATHRNDPTKKALSGLSPYLHFGQISAQRCVLEVQKSPSKFKTSIDSFVEECMVRRELADNFCYYNENYDNIDCAAEWAKESLNLHRKDKREFIYTKEQLEFGKTHDDLWNASQLQMVTEGKMHGFMRMYWAKKVLEWTESPEIAFSTLVYLNDKYELDGRDPNGYTGIAWSVCGIHDQGWREREVFGKIRYMNYQGCKRKFDIASYIKKYVKPTNTIQTKLAAKSK